MICGKHLPQSTPQPSIDTMACHGCTFIFLRFQEASFVDERRKRLQQFLRKTVQHIVASNTELESELTRARLSHIFPVLG